MNGIGYVLKLKNNKDNKINKINVSKRVYMEICKAAWDDFKNLNIIECRPYDKKTKIGWE